MTIRMDIYWIIISGEINFMESGVEVGYNRAAEVVTEVSAW